MGHAGRCSGVGYLLHTILSASSSQQLSPYQTHILCGYVLLSTVSFGPFPSRITPFLLTTGLFPPPPTANAVIKARAGWCRDVAEVLLHTILSTSNSQRMRSTAIHALNTLGQLQGVHVGVWLAPVLDNLQPPLMARRFVPVKVCLGGQH
jgi:hypothetical protein